MLLFPLTYYTTFGGKLLISSRHPRRGRSPDRPTGCISRVAGAQRITHLLSAEGIVTPNQAPRLIADGRVMLNGRPVKDVLVRADPTRDEVSVDGRPVHFERFCRYLVFHKPYGVMTGFTDPEGRPSLGDYVPVSDVYAAGRLDLDSEGLMLLTDDGWLNHRLTHPRYEHPKTYWVQIEGVPDEAALQALRHGVEIKGQRTRPATVELLSGDLEPQVPPRDPPIRYRKNVPTAWLRIVLREGRKRQVRHMTAAVGHPTLRLIRVAIGPITLGDLAPGRWRDLLPDEWQALAHMVHYRADTGAGPAGGRSSEGRRRRSSR
jgi:23S rRNA pseudouridine2457 synthase